MSLTYSEWKNPDIPMSQLLADSQLYLGPLNALNQRRSRGASTIGAGQRQLCGRRHAVDLDSLLRLTPRPQPTTIKTSDSIARRQCASDPRERNILVDCIVILSPALQHHV